MLFLNINKGNVSFINGFIQDIHDMNGWYVFIFAFFLYIILVPIWIGLMKTFQVGNKLGSYVVLGLTTLYILAFVLVKEYGQDYISSHQAKDRIVMHLRTQMIRGERLDALTTDLGLSEEAIRNAVRRYPGSLYLNNKKDAETRIINVLYDRDMATIEKRDENILQHIGRDTAIILQGRLFRREIVEEAFRREIGVYPIAESVAEFLNRQEALLKSQWFVVDTTGQILIEEK